MIKATTALLLVGPLLLLACGSRPGSSRMTPLNEALVVLEGAANLQVRDEGAQVQYEVRSPYPAQDALAAIRGKLDSAGWIPLPHDVFNPGIVSSHSRGWTRFVDGTSNPEVAVYQWSAGWKNKGGDVVNYTLQYRSEDRNAHEPSTDLLMLTAHIVPAAALKVSGLTVGPGV